MGQRCGRSMTRAGVAVLVALCVSSILFGSVQGFYTGIALGPQGYVYASAANLAQPPVLTSNGGFLNLTLTVDVMTVNTGIANFTTRGYYYTNALAAQGTVATLAAAWPGPTLRVKPGDTLVITLINSLGANPTALSMDCCGLPSSMLTGMMPTPNTTNLHFHGLATNPEIDSIFKAAAPGQTITYVLPIPSYHAPGNHWYHAHVHGSVALQVMGGLVGAIFVDPSSPSTTLPSELNAMTRYTMVFQHLSEVSANTNTDPFTVRTYPALATMAGSTLPTNFAWTSGITAKDVYLVNGQFQPKLTLAQGAWIVFDAVNAVGDHILEIDIRTAVMGGANACEAYILALDGVYLNTAPRKIADFVAMVPGQRLSFAVRCNTTGTFYLQSWADNTAGLHSSVADTEVKFNQLLMTITVTASATTMALPTTLATIPRPFYLNDLRTATVNTVWQDSAEQTGAGIGRPNGYQTFWLGIGSNCTLECGGRDNCNVTDARTTTCGYEPFAGMSRAGNYRHYTKVGNINQLTIQGRGKTPHPMHLHTMHVQLQADLGSAGTWGLAGDWRDTVPALSGSTVVRYPTFEAGEIVVHCHFLFHEDHGMMDTIYVQSNLTATLSASCVYPATCNLTAITTMPPPASSSSLPPPAGKPPAPATTGGGSATTTITSCPTSNGISTQTTVANNVLTVTRTGCPSYSPFGQKTPNTPSCQTGSTFTVYALPTISATITDISITFKNGSTNSAGGVKGTIGMSMTGIALYGDADADNRDAWVYEGASMDTCRGHADQSGTYHYHSVPGAGCAYNDTTGQHSPVFALMADGIPLYGSYGDGGVLPKDLDECGGHTDTTYKYYHYHLPDGLVAPYTVRCLRGCLAKPLGMGPSTTTPACTASPTQYNYTAMVLPWVAGLPADQSPCKAGAVAAPAGMAPPPSPAAAASSSVSMSVTMGGVDFNTLTANATRTASFKAECCSAAVSKATSSGVKSVTCAVTALLPGSVIVQMTLTSSDPSTSSGLREAANQFAANPQSSFSSTFASTYGVTSFSVVVDAEDTGSKKFPIGAIIGVAVGGAVLLALIAALIFVLVTRSSSAGKPHPAAGESSPLQSSTGPAADKSAGSAGSLPLKARNSQVVPEPAENSPMMMTAENV